MRASSSTGDSAIARSFSRRSRTSIIQPGSNVLDREQHLRRLPQTSNGCQRRVLSYLCKMDNTRQHKTIIGWIAFLAAIACILMSALGRLLGRTGDHTEVIGIVASLLTYSAACLGMKTYENVATNIRDIAKKTIVSDASPTNDSSADK